MNWMEILKNRRNIKIPKKKKGGEIDTSRFYSKPAIRDDSDIPAISAEEMRLA